jgi:hypothetical protein
MSNDRVFKQTLFLDIQKFSAIMDPSRKVPLGTCNGFCPEWQKMQSIAPPGSGGNGITPVKYPYGVTPIKYFPSGSSSVGRSMWDGWRYGANYTGPNERLVTI